jgi:hypothetical protein
MKDIEDMNRQEIFCLFNVLASRYCDMKEALEDVLWQECMNETKDGKKYLFTNGLSCYENAFDTLGYDNPSLTTAWLYEYEIFDMVRILKTFDWENEKMFIMGW